MCKVSKCRVNKLSSQKYLVVTIRGQKIQLHWLKSPEITRLRYIKRYMPHSFFSYFNFKKCEFGIYNTQIKTFLMVSLLFFDSEQLLIYKQTQENASKYPKLVCAKIAILHPAAFMPLNSLGCKIAIFAHANLGYLEAFLGGCL